MYERFFGPPPKERRRLRVSTAPAPNAYREVSVRAQDESGTQVACDHAIRIRVTLDVMAMRGIDCQVVTDR